MTTEVTFEYDRETIGKEVEVGSAEITPDRVAAYCAAVGETNPLYTDEAAAQAGPYGRLIAPPSIIQTFALRGGPNPNVKFGNTSFHAGLHMDVKAPIFVGDTISVTADVKEVYAKTGRTGTMVFAVTRNFFRNQQGEVVAVTESSSVHRQV